MDVVKKTNKSPPGPIDYSTCVNCVYQTIYVF